jgi:hypothetical protein
MTRKTWLLGRDAISDAGNDEAVRAGKRFQRWVRIRVLVFVCVLAALVSNCRAYSSDGEKPEAEMSPVSLSAPTPVLNAPGVSAIPLSEKATWQPKFLTGCDFVTHTDIYSDCMTSQIPPSVGGPIVRVLKFDAPPLMVDTSKGTLHWSPMLWQSLEFLAAEHSFRLASDPYARYLLIHKPFWHDYFASANHFNMARWGDGDDFLVNYIGHPLQGSVSGDIFLQNDPRGRSARFGRSSDYWHSRLQAMAWAAVYSTYFEIGPVLSEAAIGNEGGYSYVPTCGFSPCEKKPGVHYKSVTNNTGWVDFVVTPTVGMGWIVMEDAIEREFVDRIARGNPDIQYKVLRATLAPSRTFANVLAGKSPWYRYPESDYLRAAGGGMYEEETEIPEWKSDPRWQLGFQMTSVGLPVTDRNCPSCQDFRTGAGFNFNYRFAKYAYLDSEVNFLPGSDTFGQSGGAHVVLAGLKIGKPFRSVGIFAEVRPGWIHYDTAAVIGSISDYFSTTRLAQNFAGLVEYYPSKHSALQFNMGTTLIHYPAPYSDPIQPTVSVLSKQYCAFHASLNVATGYQFRF